MQITGLPEYYVYGAEKELLAAQAGAIATHIPAGSVVVELGCGDSSKTAILLAALLRRSLSSTGREGSSGPPSAGAKQECNGSGSGSVDTDGGAGQPPLLFVGVDVSAEALRQTSGNLARLLPELPAEQARQGGRAVRGT